MYRTNRFLYSGSSLVQPAHVGLGGRVEAVYLLESIGSAGIMNFVFPTENHTVDSITIDQQVRGWNAAHRLADLTGVTLTTPNQEFSVDIAEGVALRITIRMRRGTGQWPLLCSATPVATNPTYETNQAGDPEPTNRTVAPAATGVNNAQTTIVF